MKNTNWNTVAYVKRSRNRTQTLKILTKMRTPSEVGKEMKISLTHASKLVRELHAKKLVKCLSDKQKVGRLYIITSEGKHILKQL